MSRQISNSPIYNAGVILLCTLLIQWSSLDWNISPASLTLLSLCSAFAGWKLRQEGVLTVVIISLWGALLILPLGDTIQSQRLIITVGRISLTGAAFAQLSHAVRNLIDRYHEAVNRDSLTGLLNHKSFSRSVAERINAPSSGAPLYMAIAVADCDQFKQLNDTLGHLSGDRYLVEVVQLLNSTLQADDLAARWGGDEFLFFLTAATEEELQNRLNELHCKMNNASDMSSLQVSWSLGAVQFISPQDVSRLIDTADRAMYEAKHNGPGHCKIITEPSSYPDKAD